MPDKIMPAGETITAAAIAKHGALAGFGALVHSLNAYRNGKARGWVDVLILTIISSFSGVMFGLIGFHFIGESYLTYAITGAGGFLGIEGLAIITNAIKNSVIANLIKK